MNHVEVLQWSEEPKHKHLCVSQLDLKYEKQTNQKHLFITSPTIITPHLLIHFKGDTIRTTLHQQSANEGTEDEMFCLSLLSPGQILFPPPLLKGNDRFNSHSLVCCAGSTLQPLLLQTLQIFVIVIPVCVVSVSKLGVLLAVWDPSEGGVVIKTRVEDRIHHSLRLFPGDLPHSQDGAQSATPNALLFKQEDSLLKNTPTWHFTRHFIQWFYVPDI